MKDDYISETERKAYQNGVTAKIKGVKREANPYYLPRNRACWLEGWNETGSIERLSK